ncbi:uncharacterized protein N7477_006064 [Penicillium maclennaniae]|uniref:uncharacterized protein n=1 Tax=Penicillium maclennaniae TaxID=1343394 RepID=UPI002540DF1F|nr:uncharacterized protein N7477_006064 [Penicillium maclennaniae]KAJ5670701.1 hypothetical protein N7477_006064 [Penicillium maclennaniae]
MSPVTNFFKPPAFSRFSQTPTPERKRSNPPPRQPLQTPSYPQSDPPPSSKIDLTWEDHDEPRSQLGASLMQSISDDFPLSLPPEQSSQSHGSAPPPSSLGSFIASQRIVKDGKEVVISSDGEDTDSTDSLDDPSFLLGPKFRQQKQETKPNRVDKAYLQTLSVPTIYKHSLDSLVHAAVSDQKTEANVAKIKMGFELHRTPVAPSQDLGSKTKNGIQEGVLTSALKESEDGNEFRRLMDAIRRTEALDQDRIWRFFDLVQMTPAAPDFPRDLFPPGSHLSALREPETRIHTFQSGILEYAASLQQLPDELLCWLFRSIPLEPRDELRTAYCRIFTQTPAQRVEDLVRPDNIDELFRQMGAKPQALDLTDCVVEDSFEQLSQTPQLKVRGVLLSTFHLLQDAADLFSNDTRERAIQLLLRITLDTSLTADNLIHSELQSALSALLERVPEADTEQTERRICATVYETVREPQFQSRMLHHILPTSTWISLLRYRLGVAFLLKSPEPLTETPSTVLDLKRLTLFLIQDERFDRQLRNPRGEYNYTELTAIAHLLDIVVNSAPYTLRCDHADSAKELDAAIDKLAAQIKKIFSLIQDSGASHLKRMLAKEALEALYYRVLYAIRSKPPPKKTLFKHYGSEQQNGNLRNIFRPKVAHDTSDAGTSSGVDTLEGTAMPIRGH